MSGMSVERGNADFRNIHFGANESRADRIARLEDITRGNPNIKIDRESFNKILQGGNEIDLRLDLEAPDRRNLFIGAFASLAQLAGGLNGSAYNDALGSAITNRINGDTNFLVKHGDVYKLGLFGGAEAQAGKITVADSPTDPISPSSENIDVTAASKKLLAAQITPIQKEEPRRKLLNTGELNLAQRYGEGLSRISHAFNGVADAVRLGDPQEKDVDEISKGYAVKHNLGSDGKGLGFKIKSGELLAARGSVEGKTVQGINISDAKELTAAGATLSLNDILYLQAKQKGRALTPAENNKIQKTFQTKGIDAALVGVDPNAIKEFKANLAAAKREAGTDSAISVFIGLSTNEKIDLLKKIGATQAEIDAATSGTDPLKKIENLDALFGSKLAAANEVAQNSTSPKGGEQLSRIFKAAEVVYNEKTGGAKTDGLIGRQHVLGSQKIDNDRLSALQTAAANLTILAGNSSKDSDGNISVTDNRGVKKALTAENLAIFHNGVFVSDPVEQQKIADEYNKVNNFGAGDPRRKDFKAIVAEEQAKTLAVFNEANGSNVGSFAELANNAASGKLNTEVANTIDFSTNVSKGIINSLGLSANKDSATGSSSSSSPLKLSDAGSSIYTSSNFNFTANLVASSFLGKQNTDNANAIRNGNNFSTTTVNSDQFTLTLGKGADATTITGTVDEIAKKLEDELKKQGVAFDPETVALLESLPGAKDSAAVASFKKANNEVGSNSFSSISTKNTTDIAAVTAFLGRAGNNTDTQTQKAIGATSAIKKNLDVEIEAFLTQGGTSKEEIDKLRAANGGSLANLDIDKIKSFIKPGASISAAQTEQLSKNISAFRNLEIRISANIPVGNSDQVKLAKASGLNIPNPTGNPSTKPDVDPIKASAQIKDAITPSSTTTASSTTTPKVATIDDFLLKEEKSFDDSEKGKNSLSPGMQALFGVLAGVLKELSDHFNSIVTGESKSVSERKSEFFQKINGINNNNSANAERQKYVDSFTADQKAEIDKIQDPVQKTKKQDSFLTDKQKESINKTKNTTPPEILEAQEKEIKRLSEEEKKDSKLFNLAGNLAKGKFAQADEILQKMAGTQGFQEVFSYGFTGDNAGRITTQDSLDQQYTAVANVGKNTVNAFGKINEYAENEKARAKLLSLSTGIDKYNKNKAKFEIDNPGATIGSEFTVEKSAQAKRRENDYGVGSNGRWTIAKMVSGVMSDNSGN